jgi:hypothetical protein
MIGYLNSEELVRIELLQSVYSCRISLVWGVASFLRAEKCPRCADILERSQNPLYLCFLLPRRPSERGKGLNVSTYCLLCVPLNQ